jgi:hypothetical protein
MNFLTLIKLDAMDLKTEKSEIIRKVDQINDESLIYAIKNLLDFGLSYQPVDDTELEASIDRGLTQLEKGEGRAHKVVMAELKKEYGE